MAETLSMEVETPKGEENTSVLSKLRDMRKKMIIEAQYNMSHNYFNSLTKQIEERKIVYNGPARTVHFWMDAYKDIAHTLEQAKKYGADVSDLEPRLPELARGILKNQVSDTGGKLLTILQGARDVGVKISDIDDGTLLQLRTATEEIKK